MEELLCAENVARIITRLKPIEFKYEEQYKNFFDVINIYLTTKDEELARYILDEEFEDLFEIFKKIICKTKFFNFINPTKRVFYKTFDIGNRKVRIYLNTHFHVKHRNKVFYYYILPDMREWNEKTLKHFHRLGNDILNSNLPPDQSEFRIVNVIKGKIIKGCNVSYKYHRAISSVVYESFSNV
ncbi:hypothetical protein HNP65_001117 [Thermosipho japonicus]|uniref:Uncharacterized protein n=1 Tax=Thermosipho japonicus TaxID=90323 RepID=A0A841GSE7_9BACT|nr:hypothetical protein [Thermosipho japonicus]MBB6062679.1 hypothetical protein [Thermosipho japonicus]